ncbi:3'-5' exonuclease [Bifidobacterium avesanii]|uniref:Exonuclease domain-containing protein n=1 Tax=Bifidobacterium avesanii TaxID=1798157 RepID=A0A7K3TH79_9BIFI|nr:3'-5' exonuclease [Bifidobacterium avesanii]KAB8292806.1 DNA polymerase III subunit epsilon [Bifidobacterium avesanii]NEG78412.1 hypothetical protein [Bifidobacterium avesanii]
MSKAAYKRGRNKLHGTVVFNVGVNAVVVPNDPSRSQRFGVCSVESVPQPKGRKPHLVLRDGKGVVVLEVGAQARAAYAALQPLEGCKVRSFSWERKASDIGAGAYLSCRIVEGKRKIAAEEPIEQIILDTETTGLQPQYDEILQLSIIDGCGNALLNNLYRPKYHDSWPEAQRIHGISPTQVAGKPLIEDDLQTVQDIFDRAQQVCVYNADFDLAFLGELGLRLDRSKVVDTMREYGRRYHSTPYYKLEKAAAECGYRYHAHDALEDCRATLAVQSKLDVKPLPWRTARTSLHSSHTAMSEEDRARMESVVKTARAYDATRSDETPASVDARKPPEVGQSAKPMPKMVEADATKPVSRFYYWSFVALVCILGTLSAVLALVCIVAPYMLIMTVPAVLFTIWGIRKCRSMKNQIRTKRRRH